MKLIPLVLILLITLVSCSRESSTQLPSDPEQRWTSFQFHNYTIDQTASCFCPNGGQPMRLTVRSDTVFRVVRISDGTVLSPVEAQGYHSIESLFALIHRSSGDSLVIRYNSAYGYPELLDVNPQLHPVDGGILYQTANLRLF